jgi:ABC-type nitrate/sulfonate/bicarbonate transport system permease component
MFAPALSRREQLTLGAAGFVAFLLAWELASRAGVLNPLFFSRPTDVVAAGIREVQVPRFWTDVRVSVTEFVVGLGVAIVTAIPIGLVAGWYWRVSYFVDPWLNFINALPRVALLPIIVIWFGLGMSSKIAVVFLGAFFSIMIPTVQGVRTADRKYIDVARSFRAPQRLLFRSVIFPATVPFIVTGLRIGVARALIGVVVGELYAATDGLGVMIKNASNVLQADRMLFGVVLFTVAGVVGVAATRRLETHFGKWRPSAAMEGR